MRGILAFVLCTASAWSIAQSIYAYKSVHTDGAVTYSDTRPAAGRAVERVPIYQGSAAIEQQGKLRVQQMDAIGKELEKQRAGDAQARRDHESRLADAREEVAAAERGLALAQQSKKNASPERIAAAEQHLKLARQRLREAQSSAP